MVGTSDTPLVRRVLGHGAQQLIAAAGMVTTTTWGDGEGPGAPDQTIDTLEMLTEKTRGNLTDTESKLLESILYELHMKFVEASK